MQLSLTIMETVQCIRARDVQVLMTYSITYSNWLLASLLAESTAPKTCFTGAVAIRKKTNGTTQSMSTAKVEF